MCTTFTRITAEQLHYLPASQFHPADTYFHFSFANYYDREKMQFGALRVFNDDDVNPYDGFDCHSHQNMEIVSYIVDGTLTHWDSATGVEEDLGRGNVQIISAGKGILHSELNKQSDRCRFLQIWILPPKRELPVRYENNQYSLQARENKLLHIVGNLSNKDDVTLYLSQDVNFFVSELTDKSATVTYTLKKGRQAYLNNIEGEVTVNGKQQLGRRDSMEIVGPVELEFTSAGGQAHFILIEMAKPVPRLV